MPQHKRRTNLPARRTIYALIDEDYIIGVRDERREVVFDGIDAASFARAPATFEAAAESGWEPENWMIFLAGDVAAQFAALRARDEGWYRLELEETNAENANAEVYGAGAGERPPVRLISADRVIGRNIRAKLERYSTLSKARVSTRAEIQGILERATGGRQRLILVAYDVGQANWNALADCSGCPQTPPRTVLFFDCGLPIWKNEDTAPKTKPDPFTAAPDDAPVVLSHWHMDHWTGAALGKNLFDKSNSWHAAALTRKWIVPNLGKRTDRQRLQPTALLLALALRRNGNLVIWPTRLKRVTTRSGHTVVQCEPTGTAKRDNNNSGLALIAQTPNAQGEQIYTLAAGDAEYSSIAVNFPRLYSGMRFAGVVATHHGAAIRAAPPKAAGGWNKLVFSHGDRYGHPTNRSRLFHEGAGWRYHYETHTRVHRTLATGVSQVIGSTCLGADQVAVAAGDERACQYCKSATETCPVK